ncbi:Centrosomal protein of 131 kDa [Schistosoma japonicum]|nr:Centrosomal protein of 131 kDa [Schistosoma japonicum]
MMNLSLKGSQINLAKSIVSSGRSSLTTSNENPRDKKVICNVKDAKDFNQDVEVFSISSLATAKQKFEFFDDRFKKDDSNICIDPNNISRTDPVTLIKNECDSPPSKFNDKSVSEWLKTHFHDQHDSYFKWNEDDCIALCPSTKSESLKSGQNPNLMMDGLNLNKDADLEDFALDLRKVINDDSGVHHTDSSEKVDVPPPCLVRPSSNSVKTSHQMSVFDEEVNLTSSKVYGEIRRNSAAVVLQRSWRRYMKKCLTAKAEMHRLLDNKKSRFTKQDINNNGQPIHLVLQNRQNVLRQKREQQRQSVIKVLNENRSFKRSQRQENAKDITGINDVLESNPSSSNEKDYTIADKSNILCEPTYTKGHQYKPCNSITHITENIKQNGSSKINSYFKGNYNHCLTVCQNVQKGGDKAKPDQEANVAGEKTMSTVDIILQELKQLESVDYLTSTSAPDTSVVVPKQVSLQKSSTPSTWSEIVKDISRVLSEAEQDEIHPNNFRKYCNTYKSTDLKDPKDLPHYTSSIRSSLTHSNSLDPSTALTSRHIYINEENLHPHTKNIEHACSRQKAQKELVQSIFQCREKLTTFIKPSHTNVRQNLSKSNGIDVSNQRTRSAKPRNSSVKNQVAFRSIQSDHFENPTSMLHTNFKELKVENKLNYKSNVEYNTQTINQSVSLMDGMKVPQSDDGDAIIANQTLLLELENKESQIKRLQKIIEHQRELSLRQLQNTQRDSESRVESLKADYEGTINRNYKLIDELIEEKKVLHTKCEKLLDELKSLTKKSEEKIKTLDEKHKVELRKVEAKHAAAEKLRREKWETEKAKHFKEVTIRGMENEVAQMIANHKAELASLRQSCAEQVQAADVRAYQAYTSHIEKIRQTFIREKEEACSRERELVEQRLNQTLSEERNSLEAHRRRLLSEISDERERLALNVSKQRAEMDTLRSNLEAALTQAKEQHKLEIQQLKADLSQRQKDEISELNKRNLAERTAWEEYTKSLLETQYTSREATLKEQLKKERDRLLESAVRRLEAEASEARLETDRQAELKIIRVREKFQAEIEELERSEKQAMEKYCLMKS